MRRLFVLREAQHLASLVSFLSSNWQTFAREGKFLAVSITFYKSKRSLEQNARYFGPAIMGQIVEQAWVDGRQWSSEAWHEYFKRAFIGVIELPGGGTKGMSSADLGVEDFSIFMDRVEAYAAQELGVNFN